MDHLHIAPETTQLHMIDCKIQKISKDHQCRPQATLTLAMCDYRRVPYKGWSAAHQPTPQQFVVPVDFLDALVPVIHVAGLVAFGVGKDSQHLRIFSTCGKRWALALVGTWLAWCAQNHEPSPNLINFAVNLRVSSGKTCQKHVLKWSTIPKCIS